MEMKLVHIVMEAQQYKRKVYSTSKGKYLDTSMGFYAKQTVRSEMKAASVLLLSRSVCGDPCEMHRFLDTKLLPSYV